MEIPQDAVVRAAEHYWVFAFDEGTAQEVRNARNAFNTVVAEAFEVVTKSSLMRGYHRPTHGEFREAFIDACRKQLRRDGRLP